MFKFVFFIILFHQQQKLQASINVVGKILQFQFTNHGRTTIGSVTIKF
jgi:hypothetical protein